MTNTPAFYEVAPRTAGLERLDIHDVNDDWFGLRDLVQHDLSALDETVLTDLPTARVRPGSNRGGDAIVFVYRVYEPSPESSIDPVVAGILIRPTDAASDDHFKVSGDIVGESRGDLLFEPPPREAIGWSAMTEAARDISTVLTRQANLIVAALKDASRQE